MKRTLLSIVVLIATLMFVRSAFAADSAMNTFTVQRETSRTRPYAGVGYFLPHEGDLNGAVMWTAGLQYMRGREFVFADVSFSTTDPSITLAAKVKHQLWQIGYMAAVGRDNRFRAGAGFQMHRMDFGFNIRRSKNAVFVLGEYDLRDGLILRGSSSLGILGSARDTVKSGVYVFELLYRFD